MKKLICFVMLCFLIIGFAFSSPTFSQQNNCCQKFQVLSSSGTCEICYLKPGIQYTALITECCSISGTPTSFKCDENEVVTIVCNSDK